MIALLLAAPTEMGAVSSYKISMLANFYMVHCVRMRRLVYRARYLALTATSIPRRMA